MNKADVRRLLLGDPRIATRIAETMGRRLGKLAARGLITLGRGRITVLDVDGLRAVGG
ncbi:MAG: helix-turn-helix domain-containing protein [Nocardioides sp.]|nr:helix-turn-helix domain-containing protein [Nocardioides sp.]